MLTFPTPAEILEPAAEWFTAFFAEFQGFIYVSVGIAFAVGLVWFITHAFHSGIDRLTTPRPIVRGGETVGQWQEREMADARRFGGWRG